MPVLKMTAAARAFQRYVARAYIIMAYIVMAYIVMASWQVDVARAVLPRAGVALRHRADVGRFASDRAAELNREVHKVEAYIVMAYIVMAYRVMADIAIAYIVMA